MQLSKQLLFSLLGVIFWFLGAMIVRFLGETVFTGHNPYLIIFYLFCFPLGYLFLLVIKHVGKVENKDIFRPVVIATFTAMFCDGIALAWFHSLYSSNLEIALHGAAAILWGGAAGLFIGHILTNKRQIN